MIFVLWWLQSYNENGSDICYLGGDIVKEYTEHYCIDSKYNVLEGCLAAACAGWEES